MDGKAPPGGGFIPGADENSVGESIGGDGMKLTIIFKEEIEEHMKKQFGPFTNPRQVYGVKSVHMEGGYLYSTISDTVRWRMDDISRFYCEETEKALEAMKK